MRHTYLLAIVLLVGCSQTDSDDDASEPTTDDFPDFITSNDDYYVTRIGALPTIEEEDYELSVTGLVDSPSTFTLADLEALPQDEITLTIECIGRSVDGQLVSTAVWGGFDLYAFLQSLGLQDGVTGVRYVGADGYYASHTLDQLQNNGLIGALTMNGEPIPVLHGYPLRILNPGYYGVKQPAWVTEIELIDMPVNDYWEDRDWDCSPPMAVDSTFFFPADGDEVSVDEPLLVGGAAFGGTRIDTVEISLDGGATWEQAEIVDSMDVDDVWVFWEASVDHDGPGDLQITARATDQDGVIQPFVDDDRYDGQSTSPSITVTVQ
jgi:DMSO/TMAO reductase YedYZ molybdopterin-dependent catalytic subunit